MLLTPNEQYTQYPMVSIDPGLNNTGVAIWQIDPYGKICSIDAYTMVTDRLIDDTGFDDITYAERINKIYRLRTAIVDLISKVNPILVACEAPFYNRRRPQAYGALLEVVYALRDSVINYNPNIPFVLLEPLLVKKTVGAGFTKGKEDMLKRVSSISEIVKPLSIPVNHLDEHAIDAIAVGYTYLKTHGVEQF